MKFLSLIVSSCYLLIGLLASNNCLAQQGDTAQAVQTESSLQRTSLPSAAALPPPSEINQSDPDISLPPVESVTASSAEIEFTRPDPIEWIRNNWKSVLRTVTITDEVEVPLIIDGENVGSARINENTQLSIHSIGSETISVIYLQGIHELPHASTNILELAERGIDFVIARAAQAQAQEAPQTTPEVTDPELESSSSGVSDSPTTGRFPEKFPLFSWDQVPVFKMFGDRNGLTDQQAQFIAATTDFVTFEKQHGSGKYQTVENGTKIDIAKLRAENPRIKALMYFNASILWPNGSAVRALFNTEEESNYFRAPLKKEFEDWTMKGQDGEPHVRGKSEGGQYFMNIAHPGYQEWWIKSAVDGVNYTNADGIYIDAFWTPAFLMQYNDLTDADSDEAKRVILEALKSKLGPEKIIFINHGAAGGALFEGGEGFMFENYQPKYYTPEAIINDWKQMKLFHDAGKLSVWRVGVEDTSETKDPSIGWEERSKELATFWTAVFLIGAQEYSYFQYGWGFQLKKGGSLVDYPEFKKRLGEPLGEYVQEGEFEFERSFKHADVWVDLQNRKAKIDWK